MLYQRGVILISTASISSYHKTMLLASWLSSPAILSLISEMIPSASVSILYLLIAVSLVGMRKYHGLSSLASTFVIAYSANEFLLKFVRWMSFSALWVRNASIHFTISSYFT